MTAYSSPRGGRRSQSRRVQVRRRRLAWLVGLGALILVVIAAWPNVRHAAQEITLPLHHEDIIRQQAADKGLDPSLVAGVIYAESKFDGSRTSAAGAEGLMQITPETAHAIALRTHGIAFHTADLATPQVNIAYGCWYLRDLLDHYDDDTVAALAAYNAGIGNVDRWMAAAKARGTTLGVEGIPYPETRAYVERVLDARDAYRRDYKRELGL